MHDFLADYMVAVTDIISMHIYAQAVSCSVVSTIRGIYFIIQYWSIK
jgi:hypothetical protein